MTASDGKPVPNSVAELKRQLEAGRAFVVRFNSAHVFVEFVETVGPVRTDTDPDGGDPHTTSASQDDLRMVMRGDLEEIAPEEIPGHEPADKNQMPEDD